MLPLNSYHLLYFPKYFTLTLTQGVNVTTQGSTPSITLTWFYINCQKTQLVPSRCFEPRVVLKPCPPSQRIRHTPKPEVQSIPIVLKRRIKVLSVILSHTLKLFMNLFFYILQVFLVFCNFL